jgi:adenylate cyclase
MSREFRIGEWLVEPNLNSISRGNQKVSVEPKVIEVLAYLAEYPGEVLSKEQIIQAVWPDTYVSGEVLRYSISELRRAFKDDARNPRIIQTISRRGYRLIAQVSKKGSTAESAGSIAVLAFVDLSASKDQEYFCDGISEEIIDNLTRLKGLRVASRTSSFAFKGKSEDVRAIGRKLGVATVLEGSVRKAADQLRVTVQLISAEDGCHLWSERYDRELKDVFAIQDEIARNIVATLKITLSPKESLKKAPTSDLQAYDYYLRGRQFFYRYTRKGMEFALKMFSQAIELDPEFARAYAGIADCCSFLYMYGGSHDEHREQADTSSRKALDLDADSAEAHASRGVALSLKGNYSGAEKEFETAIRLDPGLFEAWYFYARTCFIRGDLKKALHLYEKSIEVNPNDYQAPLLCAQIYSDLGDPDKAEASRRRGIQAVKTKLKLSPDDARALYMGANGMAALGEYVQSLQWADQALRIDPDEPMVLYNVACVQALAHKYDRALDTLEKSVKKGLKQKGWLQNDSNLDPLRKLPRFKQLLKQF